MRIGQAAEIIGKHENTIRNYAVRYAAFLSPQGAKGEHRNFTDDDVRVLSFISKLSDSGMDHTAIVQAIRQRLDDKRPFPPIQPVSSESDSRALVPVAEMESRVAAVTAELREANGRLEELRRQTEQRDRMQLTEIARLNQEIGQLKAQLAQIEAERQ